jgi:hypothetical protein
VSDTIAKQATASDLVREILPVRGQLLGQVLTVWMDGWNRKVLIFHAINGKQLYEMKQLVG